MRPPRRTAPDPPTRPDWLALELAGRCGPVRAPAPAGAPRPLLCLWPAVGAAELAFAAVAALRLRAAGRDPLFVLCDLAPVAEAAASAAGAARIVAVLEAGGLPCLRLSGLLVGAAAGARRAGAVGAAAGMAAAEAGDGAAGDLAGDPEAPLHAAARLVGEQQPELLLCPEDRSAWPGLLARVATAEGIRCLGYRQDPGTGGDPAASRGTGPAADPAAVCGDASSGETPPAWLLRELPPGGGPAFATLSPAAADRLRLPLLGMDGGGELRCLRIDGPRDLAPGADAALERIAAVLTGTAAPMPPASPAAQDARATATVGAEVADPPATGDRQQLPLQEIAPLVATAKAILSQDDEIRLILQHEPGHAGAFRRRQALLGDGDPPPPATVVDIGRLRRESRPGAAARACLALLEGGAGKAVLLGELAEILVACDRLGEAEILQHWACRLDEEDSRGWQRLVWIYRVLGHETNIAQTVRTWMRRCHRDPRALLEAAVLTARHGNGRAAGRLLELRDRHRPGTPPGRPGTTDGEPAVAPVAIRTPPREESADDGRGPDISVLLCCYNRADRARRCLAALGRQTLPRDRWEVVCVNDGSTDATGEVMRAALADLPGCYHEHATNRALAAARNTAIAAARGRLLLFINDDTYPAPDMLAEHVAAHRRHGGEDGRAAVLGHIAFTPEIGRRVISRALHEHNLLFTYMGLPAGVEIGFDNFITGNLSVPRRAFLDEDVRFDETFLRYGCEDIEAGYRLWKAGYRVYYHPAARADHDHLMTVADYERRTVDNNTNLVQYLDKHPELVLHYFGMPVLTEERIARWRRETDAFAPGLETLRGKLTALEDVPADRLGPQAPAVVATLGKGLRRLMVQVMNRTIVETLDALPELRARLVLPAGEATP